MKQNDDQNNISLKNIIYNCEKLVKDITKFSQFLFIMHER